MRGRGRKWASEGGERERARSWKEFGERARERRERVSREEG